jgi:integrase
MAVLRDASGRWRYRKTINLPGGRKERISGTPIVNTKMAAENAEREHIQRLLSAPSTPPPAPPKEVPTFAKFAEEFMATYSEANNKPSEVQSKRTILRCHLLAAFGEKKLDVIQQREIEAYKSAKLKAGLAPKSVNNHLTILRRILSLAAEWGVLTHTPPVKWLKCPEPEFDFLDFDEAVRLEKGAAGEWAVMITVGLTTGLRQGELLALRWEDVDLVRGRLLVRRAVARGVIGTPKSGKSREIPLNEKALAALKRQRHLRGELVFCDDAGKMLRKGSCKWPLWSACKRAGLRRIGWHVLRHTFASHLVMRRAPLKAVQELLGHSTIEMTMRYSHLSPDVRKDAVRLLDADPSDNRLTTASFSAVTS